MDLARRKPHGKPDKLTSFEQYALVEALSFFMAGAVFPNSPPPVTFLQYIFLLEGYKLYYEERTGTVYSPEFEKGMQEIDRMG